MPQLNCPQITLEYFETKVAKSILTLSPIFKTKVKKKVKNLPNLGQN